MGNHDDARFIRRSDPVEEQVIFNLPTVWWSRCFEYAWALQFAKSGQTVLDAACGLGHPLKFALLDRCQEVHACDVDARILSQEEILNDIAATFGIRAVQQFPEKYLHNIHYAQADVADLPYSDRTFDTIFCISVLEHLSQATIRSALVEFARTLQDDGQIILTFDYPNINLDLFQHLVETTGLEFCGNSSFDLPGDAIYTPMYGGLYCFRTVLQKKRLRIDLSKRDEEVRE